MSADANQAVTALFADIQGYSKIVERDEATAIKRADQAINLITSLIEDYGGEVVNVAGDGVLALFYSASDALHLAVAVQSEMNNDVVWNSGETPIVLRIGASFGELIQTRSGVRGHQLNVAARLQQIAPPGGILVTREVIENIGDGADVRFRSLGKKKLKNISEYIEVSEVVMGSAKQEAKTFFRERDTDKSYIKINSLAVLDLVNASGEDADLHLCSGVTSDIISNLTRFRDLHVIAHRSSSMFDLRDRDPSDIGEMLGVSYLISGSLTRWQRRFGLNVELLDARTGKALWSERFNGVLEDVFTIGTELTSLIAARLSQEVESVEFRRAARIAPEQLQAYGLLLRGKSVYAKLSRLNNAHAHRLFEQARDADPTFSRSYVGISRTLNDAWRFHWADPPEVALKQALIEAEYAVQLDATDAKGHAAVGNALLYLRHYDQSLASYERAVRYNPNDADILAEMGHSVCVNGDPDRAIELISKAMALNPHYPDWYLWHLGEAYFDKCQYGQTIEILNRMGDHTEAYRMLAASHALLGQQELAEAAAQNILKSHPEFSLDHWINVPPDKNPEPRERLIAGLRQAGLK